MTGLVSFRAVKKNPTQRHRGRRVRMRRKTVCSNVRASWGAAVLRPYMIVTGLFLGDVDQVVVGGAVD
jgi:hypothetical protein